MNEQIKEIKRIVWESHNPERNRAHSDYSNSNYVFNRITSDVSWKNDEANLIKCFVNFTIF